MYYLMLDDERTIAKIKELNKFFGHLENVDWVLVKNYNEFCNIIKSKGVPEFVSFDHDLADEHRRPSMYNSDKHYSNYYTDGTFKEKTGYECARFLIEYCDENKLDFPEYSVHSMNPIGKLNIISIIESYKKSKL